MLILSTYKNDFFDNKDPVLMDFSGKTHETMAFEYDDATEVYASCGVFYQERVIRKRTRYSIDPLIFAFCWPRLGRQVDLLWIITDNL